MVMEYGMFNDRLRETDPLSAAVTGSSAIVLARNPNRRYAILTNDGTVPIYLALGPTAEVNKGIRLNADGGAYEINWTNYYVGDISAISDGTAVNLCIVEC